ncbi:MAG: hypothetical protein RL618_189 [Pseudomonadota bacterium]
MIHTPKTALVTGAAKRLGRSIALGLAREGWDIVVHYRSSPTEAQATAAEIRQLGRQAITLDADLADEQSSRELLPRAIASIGPISCVVNSASLFEYDNVSSFSVQRLNQHMHANLAAPVLLSKALHDATPEGSQSVVINLLDQKLFNPNPDFLSYTMSKAALQSATVLLAQALAPKVRVVGLAPGLTLVSGDQTEQGFAVAHTQTPLGKGSTPDDITAAACYLANAKAITGTVLVVDGGQHLMPMARDVMFVAK